jgi:hypothetical protein
VAPLLQLPPQLPVSDEQHHVQEESSAKGKGQRRTSPPGWLTSLLPGSIHLFVAKLFS